jgi:hypothetical protein
MSITPAEARQIARDHVVKQKAIPSDAKVRVSDFGKLADGGYSVLVDVALGATRTRGTTRYRVKMDGKGNVKSLVSH